MQAGPAGKGNEMNVFFLELGVSSYRLDITPASFYTSLLLDSPSLAFLVQKLK